MSYILEALKKSDKERQREKIPDLQADHSFPSVKRQNRKGPGLYLLGTLVLGLLATLAWWQFFDGQVPQLTDNSKTVPVPVVVVQNSENPDNLETPEQTTAQPSVTKKEKTAEIAAPAAAPDERPVPDITTPEVRLSERHTTEESEGEGEVTGKSVSPASSEPEGHDEMVIPFLNELPPQVKAGVPELSFAGHVYADEVQKRLIIINNRIVREGAMISNGLFLEQIEPDGVVLRHEAVVFRVQLF